MINGLEGVPGSGKSYEATVYHVLAALKKGRKVITNLPLDLEVWASIDPAYLDLIELRKTPMPIRGTWDADAASRDEPAFKLFEDGHTEKPVSRVRTFGHVWDYYSDWKSDEWAGPLFVIDECHVPLPRIGTDPEVEQWFKLHRHFNADVLLMTQRFRGMCEEIAALMGMLVKVRKADILGRADHYIRKVHGGYRGAVISTEERKYKPEFFPLYKSHTQGSSMAEAAATDVAPFIVKFNRFKRVFVVLTLCFSVYAFWPGEAKPKPKPVKTSDMAWYKDMEAQEARRVAEPVSSEPVADSAPVVEDSDPEPFAKQAIHITGWLRLGDRLVYTFAVSSGGARLFDLRLPDLVKAGYRFDPLGECSGMLRWKDKVRAVTCDAPQFATGSQSTPVVLAVGGQRSSVN